MKKARIVAVMFLCIAAFFMCCADESSNVGRIHFYYQYDGAPADEPGKWDILLKDRLQALYGHDSIYYGKGTSMYMTGRACRLFSYCHAYQYLLGYAETEAEQADLLYRFLSIRPVWSNTGSSMSPPNAQSIYAAYMAKQPGVKTASTSLGSFQAVHDFFASRHGVLIVNAPGHIIIATGTTTHGGVNYVHMVDSVLSGTIRATRCTQAKSMDFSVTYTPDNSPEYTPYVHEYWLPYSQFSGKCKIVSAFYTGAVTADWRIRPDRNQLLLSTDESYRLTLTGRMQNAAFESSDESVCVVSDDGTITAVACGSATVTCRSVNDEFNFAQVPVYVADFAEGTVLYSPNRIPEYRGELPEGAYAAYDDAETCGVYDSVAHVYAQNGEKLKQFALKLVVPDMNAALVLPKSLISVEESAFEDTCAQYVFIPQGVRDIADGVFDGSPLQAVIFEGESVGTDAFSEDCFVITDAEAVAYFANGEP